MELKLALQENAIVREPLITNRLEKQDVCLWARGVHQLVAGLECVYLETALVAMHQHMCANAFTLVLLDL